MLNFTVGPVMSDDAVLEVAAHSAPYFRTPEFSEVMLDNEKRMLDALRAPSGSRCVFLTTSGTGAMESLVMHVLGDEDRVLVIDGGSFGHRFVELCALHGRDFTMIPMAFGSQIRAEQLNPYADQGYTALLVNMHETSSGLLYDMKLLADFCRKQHMILVVDAISAFLSDPLDMAAFGAAAVITGSQKALALHPGMAVVALSPEGIERVNRHPEKSMYLSLKRALANQERGQTPFTPAVTTLLELHARLESIEAKGGVEAERAEIACLAAMFRAGIRDLPLEAVPETPSNAVTAVKPIGGGAKEILRIMKDEYGMWLCPNGGEMADTVFRVGHIGHITEDNMRQLLAALHDLHARGLLGGGGHD